MSERKILNDGQSIEFPTISNIDIESHRSRINVIEIEIAARPFTRNLICINCDI